MSGHFTPDLFGFLKDLRKHNDRDWFNANKARYERSARDPLLRFIAELGPGLAKLSAHFVADPRPAGGSMLRIHRDVRFSKDKSPYKTALMAHFGHDQGEEGATPALYLRLTPGDSAVGAGIWRPAPPALKLIRERIVADTKGWRHATSGRTLGRACAMAGESLKRPPPGFDPAHPCVEDLKRKDFALITSFDDAQVGSPRFLADVLSAYRSFKPFLGFLAGAVGLRL
ncbi:MAG: DUF2461 domain-containing protein [Deltaproteobacteria bacterium]|nr:DUF2461 domain-containing protein [Deltaproteobacteria bacterium]